MKNILNKHKEIIISFIIILILLVIIELNFYKEYTREVNKDNNVANINIEQEIRNRKITKNSYYIDNNKLYISYDGESSIEVPGDFSEILEYEEGTYQISEIKTVFYYTLKNKKYIVYSNDCGNNWSTVEIEENGNIKYIEFINKDTGYMYQEKDIAMTIAFGAISKTIDGGNTWQEISLGIDGVFKRDSKIKFFDNHIGFITMPNNGGDSCDLYITHNDGNSFEKVVVEYIPLNDTELKWEEIYDYYNIPEKRNWNFYLEIGQGADGDYNGGNSIEYYSYNGIYWTTDEIEKKKSNEINIAFDERVKNRLDKIFLKDFKNYNPSSSEIKISQSDAEKIVEIGFEEAATVGEAGYKESQKVRVEEVIANNFFTMDHNCITELYQNIKRKCYVFTRENEMGCGAMVYVDVTTGLIIGGGCFGD